MLNFAAIAFVAVYEPQPPGKFLYISTFILVSAALFVFAGIVIYHLWYTMKVLRKLTDCFKNCKVFQKRMLHNSETVHVQNYGAIKTHSTVVDVTYSDNLSELKSPEDIVAFREPVLDYDNAT